MQNKYGQLLRPIIIYGLICSILFWLFYFQSVELPEGLGGILPGFNLTQLLAPSITSATLLFLSQIVDLITAGRLVKPLKKTLRINSITLTLFIISNWPQIPSYLAIPLALPVTLSLLYAVIEILNVYLTQYREYVDPVLRGLRIAFTGLLVTPVYYRTLTEVRSIRLTEGLTPLLDNYIFNSTADTLGNLFRLSAILVAILCFLGLLENQRDPYLSYIGKVSGHRLFVRFLLIYALSIYFTVARTVFLDTLDLNGQLLSLVEWTIVCLLFYYGYKSANNYAKNFVDNINLVEKWTKHKQQISYTPDKKLEQLSAQVEDFIMSGDNSMLIITLSCLLAKYGYNPEKIHGLLGEIMMYRDIVPGAIIFGWQLDLLNLKNRENRRRLIAETLQKFESLGVISSNVQHQENEEYEVNKNEF